MAFRAARLRGWTLAAALATAAVVAAVMVRFWLTPPLPAYCYLAAVAVPLAFIDARQRRLPNLATLPSYPASLLLLGVAAPFVADGSGRFIHALIGMAAAVGAGAAWPGWADSEPAGWKTPALPLPQPATPATTLAARIAADRRRPMLPP